jgi:hypothetical protein
MRRGLFVSLCFLALTGCATGPSLRSRMAAYIGADMQTLVQQLGVPDKHITVNGVQYVAYVQSHQEIDTGAYMGGWYGGAWGGPFYGGGFYPQVYGAGLTPRLIVYGCETTFMLRGDKVFNFTLRGDDCG